MPTNQKIEKMVSLFKALDTALNDHSKSGQLARAMVMRAAVPPTMRAPRESFQQIAEWFSDIHEISTTLSSAESFFLPNNGIEKPTKMRYKTYLIGKVLPDLFNELYGAHKFGSHNPQNDYSCAGIHFVFECSQALGMEGVSYSSISKATQRSNERFHNHFETYEALLEQWHFGE
jgi:hypothetical protein